MALAETVSTIQRQGTCMPCRVLAGELRWRGGQVLMLALPFALSTLKGDLSQWTHGANFAYYESQPVRSAWTEISTVEDI